MGGLDPALRCVSTKDGTVIFGRNDGEFADRFEGLDDILAELGGGAALGRGVVFGDGADLAEGLRVQNDYYRTHPIDPYEGTHTQPPVWDGFHVVR